MFVLEMVPLLPSDCCSLDFFMLSGCKRSIAVRSRRPISISAGAWFVVACGVVCCRNKNLANFNDISPSPMYRELVLYIVPFALLVHCLRGGTGGVKFYSI